MRKTTFTKSEFEQLRKLISQKVSAERNEQKKIRNAIRKIGFYFSDFSPKKGYDISDLEELVRKEQIKIIDDSATNISTKQTLKGFVKKSDTVKTSLISDPFKNSEFRDFNDLSDSVLSKMGLYCIRLKKDSKLPPRYQKILDKRSHRILYIGKAQSQSLNERLGQEIFHINPGTYFRSIGAVLQYKPIPGHLKGKNNQNNYKFSSADTEAITNWLLKNTEFIIQEVDGDFSIEHDLIKKYCPLLNYQYNPFRLSELVEDKKKCREIAVGY